MAGRPGSETPPHVLRLHRPGGLVSAGYFDAIYPKALATALTFRDIDPLAFTTHVLGPLADPARDRFCIASRDTALHDAAHRFREAVRGAAFFHPGYAAVHFAPLFALLRNTGRLTTRCFLVAHAPGAYLMEWALLQHLLGPGDCIIAPSRSARDVILHCAPTLAECVRVAHHPMPMTAEPARTGSHLVSIGRVAAGKLRHRELDALAALHAGGRLALQLTMAGPLEARPPDEGLSGYARSLLARRRRLGLEAAALLPGAVTGPEAQAALYAGAGAALCLSNTIEEAFPKASVEALRHGVPVVAARFGGYVETVGEAGALVPLHEAGPGVGVDLEPCAVAEAAARMLDDPPPAEALRAQAARFLPERSAAQYAAAVADALAAPCPGALQGDPLHDGAAWPAAGGGLLSRAAPLTHLDAGMFFSIYVNEMPALLKNLQTGEELAPTSDGGVVRQALVHAVGPALQRRMAGLAPREPLEDVPEAVPRGRSGEGAMAGTARDVPAINRNLQDTADPPDMTSLLHHAVMDGLATPTAPTAPAATAASRRSCAMALLQRGAVGLFHEAVRGLVQCTPATPGRTYLEALALESAGETEAAARAWATMLDGAAFGVAGGAGVARALAANRRCAGNAAEAAAPLRRWLAAFPDEEDSGAVWLDFAMCLLESPAVETPGKEGGAPSGEARARLQEAERAVAQATALLGAHPLVAHVQEMVRERLVLLGLREGTQT